jgi:hypothetical protein
MVFLNIVKAGFILEEHGKRRKAVVLSFLHIFWKYKCKKLLLIADRFAQGRKKVSLGLFATDIDRS